MKKIVAGFMAGILMISLAACGKQVQGFKKGSVVDIGNNISVNEKTKATEIKTDQDKYDEAWNRLNKMPKTQKGLQNFSIDTFKTLAGYKNLSKDNMMISPLSMIMALGMLENGVQGNSEKEIAKLLNVKANTLNKWLKAWSTMQKANKESKLHIGNSLWFKETERSFRLKEAFLDKITGVYGADLFMAKFDQTTVDQVNQWIDKNTDGMIKKMFEKFEPDTISLLINAIAFQGTWRDEYKDENVVKDEEFTRGDGTKEKVTMLHSKEDLYIENKKVTGFTKEYKDGYYFVALLPKEGVSLEEYVKGLNGSKFRNLFTKYAKYGNVNAVIPEFKSEYTEDNVKKAFEAMGVKEVFDSKKADLRNMFKIATCENAYVQDIKHKTFIQLDREGTKAAAATAVVIGKCTSVAPTEEYTVRLDRPFIYAIMDNVSHMPVFIGTVAKIH